MRRSLRVSLPLRLRPTTSAPSSPSSIHTIARQPANRAPAARQFPPPSPDRFRSSARRCLHTTTRACQEAEVAQTPETDNSPAVSETKSKPVFKEVKPVGRFLTLFKGNVTRRLDVLWLRDSCSCPKCLDPDSGQKTFATTDLPLVPKIKQATLDSAGNLTVIWESDPLSNGQEHTTVVTNRELKWLHNNGGPRIQHAPPPQKTLWDKATFEELRSKGKCAISYSDWMTNDEAFWAAFRTFTQTGLLFVQDVPESETSVEDIAERIGMIQHTFYGRTWDVKSKPNAENVAYTNVFLGLHQDLMYHVPIPRLQLLHCIANSSEGGESLFSDGFRAAAEIRNNFPEHYEALTSKLVQFGYEKGGNHYHRALPTFELDGAGSLVSTHWAPPFQTTFVANEFDQLRGEKKSLTLAEWKLAAERFKSNIEDPKNVVEVKMKPGECVIFDNWRILHGRNEFAVGGQGTRWLKGTYISPQVYQAKETALTRRLLGEDGVWLADNPAHRLHIWEREQMAWAKKSNAYEFVTTKEKQRQMMELERQATESLENKQNMMTLHVYQKTGKKRYGKEEFKRRLLMDLERKQRKMGLQESQMAKKKYDVRHLNIEDD